MSRISLSAIFQACHQSVLILVILLIVFVGLIASVSRGSDDGSIALVEKMVASYILKPSCIILLTVTCESKSKFHIYFPTKLINMQPTLKTKAPIVWQKNMTLRANAPLVRSPKH